VGGVADEHHPAPPRSCGAGSSWTCERCCRTSPRRRWSCTAATTAPSTLKTRFLADRIPHARLALLAGEDTILWAGDVDAIAAEIEAWLPTLAGRVG
jgi:hypothetical protein